jgi:hypothetical protein
MSPLSSGISHCQHKTIVSKAQSLHGVRGLLCFFFGSGAAD